MSDAAAQAQVVEDAEAFWRAVGDGAAHSTDECARLGSKLAAGTQRLLAQHGSGGHAALWSGVPGCDSLAPGFRGPMATHARVGARPDWAASNPCAVVGVAALGQPLPLQHVAAWAAAAYALAAPAASLRAVDQYAAMLAAQAHGQQGPRARELLAVGAAQARNLVALRGLLEPWVRLGARGAGDKVVLDAWPGRDACGPSLAHAVVEWHPTAEDAARIVAMSTPAALAVVDASRAAARQPACALDQAAVDGRHELVAQMLDALGPGVHVVQALRAVVEASQPRDAGSESARCRAIVIANLASRVAPEQLFEAKECVAASLQLLCQGAPLSPSASAARGILAAAAAALAAASVPGVLLPGASVDQTAAWAAAREHEEGAQRDFNASMALLQRKDGDQARIFELEALVERQRRTIEHLERQVGELQAQAEMVGEAAIAELHQLMALPLPPVHGVVVAAPVAAAPLLADHGRSGPRLLR